MRKGMLLVLLLALLAVPAVAQAGFWVGPAASYEWKDEYDLTDYKVVPALAVGFEVGPLEIVAKHPFNVHQSGVDEWFKEGKYQANAVLKFRF